MNKLKLTIRLMYFSVFFIVKTLTYDLFNNIVKAVRKAKHIPEIYSNEELSQIASDNEKESIARVLYAMNNDINYLRTEKGEFDLKVVRSIGGV